MVEDTFGMIVRVGDDVLAMSGTENRTRLIQGEIVGFSSDYRMMKLRITATCKRPNDKHRIGGSIWVHAHRSAKIF